MEDCLHICILLVLIFVWPLHLFLLLTLLTDSWSQCIDENSQCVIVVGNEWFLYMQLPLPMYSCCVLLLIWVLCSPSLNSIVQYLGRNSYMNKGSGGCYQQWLLILFFLVHICFQKHICTFMLKRATAVSSSSSIGGSSSLFYKL